MDLQFMSRDAVEGLTEAAGGKSCLSTLVVQDLIQRHEIQSARRDEGLVAAASRKISAMTMAIQHLIQEYELAVVHQK